MERREYAQVYLSASFTTFQAARAWQADKLSWAIAHGYAVREAILGRRGGEADTLCWYAKVDCWPLHTPLTPPLEKG